MCVFGFIFELFQSEFIVFIKFRKFMAKYSSIIFPVPSSLSSPFGTPFIHPYIKLLEVVPQVIKPVFS